MFWLDDILSLLKLYKKRRITSLWVKALNYYKTHTHSQCLKISTTTENHSETWESPLTGESYRQTWKSFLCAWILLNSVEQKLGLADTNIQPELTLTHAAHSSPYVYCEWSPCPGQRGELLLHVILPRWGGWQVIASAVEGTANPDGKVTYVLWNVTTDTQCFITSSSSPFNQIHIMWCVMWK